MDKFNELFEPKPFVDRFAIPSESTNAVDVIIPLLHSTELWTENLKSYFREIPIKRLLVGNAGAIDGSDAIVAEFPRTTVFDHSMYKTLGKSLSALISEVQSERFVYVQSDVYLPPGWFDAMVHSLEKYDWVGCPERTTVMVQFETNYSGKRPLAGAQMGRTSKFSGIDGLIEDDFVYRQEDFVLEQWVVNNGGRSGENDTTYHVHQVMERRSVGEANRIKSVSIIREPNLMEQQRVHQTQVFGLIKYCKPDDLRVVSAMKAAAREGILSGAYSRQDLVEFAINTNPRWLPHIITPSAGSRVIRRLKSILRKANPPKGS